MPTDEIQDVYSYCFNFAYNPFGVVLTFALSDPRATAPGDMPVAPKQVVRVRMSMETFKLMLMKSVRTVRAKEHSENNAANLPVNVLNGERLSPDDWNSFWSYGAPSE